MGGLGSGGSRSSSRYLTVEQCYDLDLADLARAGFLEHPGHAVIGRWSWTTRGGHRDGHAQAVQVKIDRREEPGRFAIYYGEDTGDDAPAVCGKLTTTLPHLGGVRYWWRCPRCGRRRRVLYAHPTSGRERFMCRRCQDLRYYSHRESAPDRLHRKAGKLYRRAGSTDGAEPWRKPKWMRWDTFSRLVLEGRAAAEAGDRLIVAGLDKAIASIQGHRRRGP